MISIAKVTFVIADIESIRELTKSLIDGFLEINRRG
jgi:hypothetical protein